MKAKLTWLIICLFIIAMFSMITACEQPAADPVEEPENGEVPPPDDRSVEFLSIVTGGTGGVYFPYGGGMSTVINRHIPYLRATAEVTGASVENTRMITEQTAELALIMNDVGYMAYNGEGEQFEGDPQPIRTAFTMYPNLFHMVVLADSDIYNVSDIVGRTASVGAPGSGTEFKTNLVLGALGITYDDFDVFRLPFAETGDDLRDGRIDIGFWSVAAPTSSIMEITATRDIRIVAYTDEEIEALTSEYPFYSGFEMPADMYPGQDESVLLPSVWNSVICHADYPEEYVYDITKAIFENIDHLVAIHAYARMTTPENTVEHAVLPLHPGVIKYFEEIGVDVPDHLIPPELQ